MTEQEEWRDYFKANETDVFAYFGPVERKGYDLLCKSLPANKQTNALLVLCTYGGDPDAGYRIARALLHHYGKNFRVLLPSYCKSAGTLICIGAHELLMADSSELGPLDIQIRKKDELFQQNSGLDIVRGISFLNESAIDLFRDYLLDVNAGSGVSTKTASEIASRLVIGLYEPMYAQVDPMRLGEMNAALQIAVSYGERLQKKSENLKVNALNRLIHGYPSHSFVIDRAEAREIFERVASPSPVELHVAHSLLETLWSRNDLNVIYFNAVLNSVTQPDLNEEAQNDISNADANESAESQPAGVGEQHGVPTPGSPEIDDSGRDTDKSAGRREPNDKVADSGQ